jgi:hypothetical protein
MTSIPKYFIGPQLLGDIRRVIGRVDADPIGSEVTRIPTRLQDMRRGGGGGQPLRIVTFTGAWNKNTFKTIAASGGTEQIQVRNSLATIDAGCGEARKGVIAQIEGVWELIAAECA